LSGAYTRPDREIPPEYQGPDARERLIVLQKIAAETGATPNQVIYAWMLQNEPAVIPLLAASTPAQMEENLGALNVQLSPDQISRLNDAGA
jgi:aryl-alcohol dehydrogenase-like predicted oxidoreductase